MSGGKQPSVLIVILNYNTYELTLKLISELNLNLDYKNYSILVVDNCSPNESVRFLKEKQSSLCYNLIVNKTNAGFAAGNNVGIRYAINHGFKYSWIINNDITLVDKKILRTLVTQAEANVNAACIGPKIMDLQGNLVPPFIERPTRWSMTLGIASSKKRREKAVYHSRKVYRVYGCCMLVNNSWMRKVGFMDERTFLYYEEDILAERLLGVGAYAYYCAEAEIVHLESMTVNTARGNKARKKCALVLRSMDIYLKEYLHYGPLSRFMCEAVRALIILLR